MCGLRRDGELANVSFEDPAIKQANLQGLTRSACVRNGEASGGNVPDPFHFLFLADARRATLERKARSFAGCSLWAAFCVGTRGRVCTPVRTASAQQDGMVCE